MYAKQERLENEYGQSQLLKREARVMVAAAVSVNGQNQIAIMDFGVGKDGKLAQISSGQAASLPLANTPLICNALEFNSQHNTEVNLPWLKLANLLHSPTQWMVGVWVKLQSKTCTIIEGGAIAGLQPGQTAPPLFALSLVDGSPRFIVQNPNQSNGQTNGFIAQAASPLKMGFWYYLMGTWDGTTASIYIDGYVAGQTQQEESTGVTITNTGVQIGGGPGNAAAGILDGFTGLLGSVQIWPWYTASFPYAYMSGGLIPCQHPGLGAFWTFFQSSPPPNSASISEASRASGGPPPTTLSFPDVLMDLTVYNNNAMVSGARWVPTNAPPAVTTWFQPSPCPQLDQQGNPIWTATVTASMPPVACDENGLTACTTLLDFAQVGSGSSVPSPFLFEGSDGLVHLYFQNANEQMLSAAHYDTVTARASYIVPWQTGSTTNIDSQTGMLRFIARQTGTLMNSDPATAFQQLQWIAVTPNNDDPTQGQVVLTGYVPGSSNNQMTYTALTETWPNVPLEISAFCAVLNGDAIQTTTNPVAGAEHLVMYDYTQVTVSPAGAEPQPPGPGTGSGIFSVMPDSSPDNGLKAYVSAVGQSNPAMMARPGIDCWWVADPPGAALQLNQSTSNQYVQVFDQQIPSGSPLNLKGSMSMEAWVYPSAVAASTSGAPLIFFSNSTEDAAYVLGIDPNGQLFAGNTGVAQITNLAAGQAVPLNTWTHVAATSKSGYGIKLSGSKYLDAGSDTSLDTVEGLTIACWVKLDKTRTQQVVASKWGKNQAASSALGGGSKSWQLYINDDNQAVFEVNQEKGNGTVSVQSERTITAGEWTYLAGVYDVSKKKETAIQFQSESSVSIPTIPNYPTTDLTFEAWVKLASPSAGSYASIVTAYMGNQKAFSLTVGPAPDSTQYGMIAFSGPGSLGTPGFPWNQWVHVAVTFNSQGIVALYINGVLLTSADLPIVTFKTSLTYQIGNQCVGWINDVSLWNVALSAEQIQQTVKTPPTGNEAGIVGCWPFQDRIGTQAMDLAGTTNGTLQNGASFAQVDKGMFAQKIFLIPEGSLPEDLPSPAFQQVATPLQISNAPLLFGEAEKDNYLQGTISAASLWQTGLMDWEVYHYSSNPPPINAEGLIGDWSFASESGSAVYDSTGNNNAIIKDAKGPLDEKAINAMWVPAWIKGSWKLYLNGIEAASTPYTLSSSFFSSAQCTLGAMLSGGSPTSYFAGQLCEVQVWDRELTGEEIRDSMNSARSGSEDGLVGYWPMDEGSGITVGDQSPYSNNGTLINPTGANANWVWSMAPIDIEAPQVLNVPGGLVYQPMTGGSLYFSLLRSGNQAVNYSPAVAEYGDLQVDADGRLFGVLKRCYVYIQNEQGTQNGVLYLITGYKVGDLDVQYVGQVQTKPTLVGYIEGAPPLPSENLTVDSPITPYKYLAASTVTVTEADNVSHIYTASRDTGFDMSVDTKMGVYAHGEAEAGVGFELLVAEAIAKMGIHATFDHSLGWLSEARISDESASTVAKRIEVFGSWMDNNDPNLYDPRLGPRIYFPNNMGYALVKSGTADLFALRLKGTGAMVAYSLRPTPGVPQDTNIIMFKIDPRYVKNGSLDGYIGFKRDPDSSTGEKASYFKPLEAYALKTRIEREAAELESYYDEFSAGAIGRRQKDDIGSQDSGLAAAIAKEASGSEDWMESMSGRSLVNTYVWNSAGGLYIEDQQFSFVQEESAGGSYDFVGKAGLYAELSISFVFDFALDALFGGHIRTKAMKTKSEGSSFGLSITAPGEGFLNLRAAEQPSQPPPGQYPVIFQGASCPGKVNQYRFMSFYLAPAKQNFDEFFSLIVDQDWLNRQEGYAGTYDPDAFALRQAQGNTNEVWRVLHRVTYVNRVPEPLINPQGESLPSRVQPPDEQSINSNRLLIDDLPVASVDGNALAQISSEVDALFAALLEMQLPPAWVAFLLTLPAQQEEEMQAEMKRNIMTYMRSYHAIG